MTTEVQNVPNTITLRMEKSHSNTNNIIFFFLVDGTPGGTSIGHFARLPKGYEVGGEYPAFWTPNLEVAYNDGCGNDWQYVLQSLLTRGEMHPGTYRSRPACFENVVAIRILEDAQHYDTGELLAYGRTTIITRKQIVTFLEEANPGQSLLLADNPEGWRVV